VIIHSLPLLVLSCVLLDPPPELLSQIFPWIEDQQAALVDRERCNPLARDIALAQFLNLLIWLRTVILQDTAVLYCEYPRLPLFQYLPFNSAAFHAFANASTAILARAASDAEMALKSLPENLVSSMNGFLTRSTIHTEALHTKSTVQLEAISDRLGHLEDLIKMLLGAKKSARYKGNQLFNLASNWHSFTDNIHTCF
jgi:hypothetical protein